MRTAYISHRDCLEHDNGPGHPESPARLHAIEDALIAGGLMTVLRHFDAPEATREQLARVHEAGYLDRIEALAGTDRPLALDPDTPFGPGSLPAALRAAGAVVEGVERIMAGEVDDAFCAVRPPGHHAEPGRAMGFCVFNNVAVGVAHALEVHGLERVAVVDFDVHHGNGTEAMFRDDERVLFCSTFRHPYYPHSPLLPDHPRIILELQGHSDSRGSEEHNQRVSQQRAEAVLEDLVARGVDRARLRAVGYGSSRPLESNDTARGRGLNRRVAPETDDLGPSIAVNVVNGDRAGTGRLLAAPARRPQHAAIHRERAEETRLEPTPVVRVVE